MVESVIGALLGVFVLVIVLACVRQVIEDRPRRRRENLHALVKQRQFEDGDYEAFADPFNLTVRSRGPRKAAEPDVDGTPDSA